MYVTFSFTDARYIHPMLERFSIQLISPARWEIVPHVKYVSSEILMSYINLLNIKCYFSHDITEALNAPSYGIKHYFCGKLDLHSLHLNM